LGDGVAAACSSQLKTVYVEPAFPLAALIRAGHVRSPKTIVYGAVADVDDEVHDTPTSDPPKPPAET